MDDDFFVDDETSTSLMTRNVVRRYERQSQSDFEIDFFGSVLARSPNYAEVVRVLANNLGARGERDAAFELESRLVELRPNDAAAHYNLACSLSAGGRLDEAMDHLEQALALGYENTADLLEDRELTPLHREPRFLQLLTRLLEEADGG